MGPATIPRQQLGGTPWGGAERASGDLKRTTVGEEEAALIVRESGVLAPCRADRASVVTGLLCTDPW